MGWALGIPWASFEVPGSNHSGLHQLQHWTRACFCRSMSSRCPTLCAASMNPVPPVLSPKPRRAGRRPISYELPLQCHPRHSPRHSVNGTDQLRQDRLRDLWFAVTEDRLCEREVSHGPHVQFLGAVLLLAASARAVTTDPGVGRRLRGKSQFWRSGSQLARIARRVTPSLDEIAHGVRLPTQWPASAAAPAPISLCLREPSRPPKSRKSHPFWQRTRMDSVGNPVHQ